MQVIDASVLADALIDDGVAGQAARRALGEDPHWAAPAHVIVEVLSVIRGRARGGKLSATRAQEAVAALPELTIDEVPLAPLAARIWELRANLTAYDAAYVAAAEAVGCRLVTGDGRLAGAPGVGCPVHVMSG